MTNDQLAEALSEALVSPNEQDQNVVPANVVDGLFVIAQGLQGIAVSIKYLGNADAATPLGALEALGIQLEKASTLIADALSESGRE